jgi:sugar lactone lactonase YvrE
MSGGCALDNGLFLESPRWHAGKLWASDVLAGTVLTVTPGGGPEVVARIEGLPSGLGLLPDGRAIVVSMLRRQLLEVSANGERLYADLRAVLTGTPNDMIVDGEGRAFVGDIGFDLLGPRARHAGRIICVLPDGRARAVADGLDYPNGIAVSADGGSLFVAESEAGWITSFAVASDGSLTARSRVGDFGAGSPDGICLDASGAIWVSLFEAGEFVRMGRDGQVLDRVVARSPRAVACVLGGRTRDSLFCVSANTTSTDLMAGRSSSRIDIIPAPCEGAGFP